MSLFCFFFFVTSFDIGEFKFVWGRWVLDLISVIISL